MPRPASRMMVQGFPPQFSRPDSLSGDKFTLVTEKVAADQALTGQVSAKPVTPAAPFTPPGRGSAAALPWSRPGV